MNNQMVCWANSLFRIFACGLSVLAWFLSISDQRSLFAALGTSSEGYALLWMMALFGSIGMVDVVLNDLLPRRHFESTRTYRHFGLCALAFCYVSLVFVSHMHVRSTGMTLYFLWNALAIVVFAFVDAGHRAKEQHAYPQPS